MTMRAKFQVSSVVPFRDFNDKTGEHDPVSRESLKFTAVTEKPFDPDGNSEDNSFAQWTPTGNLEMEVTNPALFGTIKEGEKYYLDFTKSDEATPTP